MGGRGGGVGLGLESAGVGLGLGGVCGYRALGFRATGSAAKPAGGFKYSAPPHPLPPPAARYTCTPYHHHMRSRSPPPCSARICSLASTHAYACVPPPAHMHACPPTRTCMRTPSRAYACVPPHAHACVPPQPPAYLATLCSRVRSAPSSGCCWAAEAGGAAGGGRSMVEAGTVRDT